MKGLMRGNLVGVAVDSQVPETILASGAFFPSGFRADPECNRVSPA